MKACHSVASVTVNLSTRTTQGSSSKTGGPCDEVH